MKHIRFVGTIQELEAFLKKLPHYMKRPDVRLPVLTCWKAWR